MDKEKEEPLWLEIDALLVELRAVTEKASNLYDKRAGAGLAGAALATTARRCATLSAVAQRREVKAISAVLDLGKTRIFAASFALEGEPPEAVDEVDAIIHAKEIVMRIEGLLEQLRIGALTGAHRAAAEAELLQKRQEEAAALKRDERAKLTAENEKRKHQQLIDDVAEANRRPPEPTVRLEMVDIIEPCDDYAVTLPSHMRQTLQPLAPSAQDLWSSMPTRMSEGLSYGYQRSPCVYTPSTNTTSAAPSQTTLPYLGPTLCQAISHSTNKQNILHNEFRIDSLSSEEHELEGEVDSVFKTEAPPPLLSYLYDATGEWTHTPAVLAAVVSAVSTLETQKKHDEYMKKHDAYIKEVKRKELETEEVERVQKQQRGSLKNVPEPLELSAEDSAERVVELEPHESKEHELEPVPAHEHMPDVGSLHADKPPAPVSLDVSTDAHVKEKVSVSNESGKEKEHILVEHKAHAEHEPKVQLDVELVDIKHTAKDPVEDTHTVINPEEKEEDTPSAKTELERTLVNSVENTHTVDTLDEKEQEAKEDTTSTKIDVEIEPVQVNPWSLYTSAVALEAGGWWGRAWHAYREASFVLQHDIEIQLCEWRCAHECQKRVLELKKWRGGMGTEELSEELEEGSLKNAPQEPEDSSSVTSVDIENLEEGNRSSYAYYDDTQEKPSPAVHNIAVNLILQVTSTALESTVNTQNMSYIDAHGGLLLYTTRCNVAKNIVNVCVNLAIERMLTSEDGQAKIAALRAQRFKEDEEKRIKEEELKRQLEAQLAEMRLEAEEADDLRACWRCVTDGRGTVSELEPLINKLLQSCTTTDAATPTRGTDVAKFTSPDPTDEDMHDQIEKNVNASLSHTLPKHVMHMRSKAEMDMCRDYHVIFAQAAAEENHLSRAMSACQHVLDIHNSNDVEALGTMGQILLAWGRDKEAFAVWERLESNLALSY